MGRGRKEKGRTTPSIECNRNCNRLPSNPSHAMQRRAICHISFFSDWSCEFCSGEGESREDGLASLSLENCCRGNSTVGSNPTLSAYQQVVMLNLSGIPAPVATKT